MVPDTVEREVERKNLHAQIQILSLIMFWVGAWWVLGGCDVEQVRRIR